ncbi:MAG: hypothetical protein J6E38_01420 [Clostridia bacterium]|nr:hypothetical protein [Clostridia bacterium]
MKKVLAIIFACALVFMCCACSSGNEATNDNSVEDMVERAARSRVQAEVMINYSSHAPTVTSLINNSNGDTYYVSGKVTVRDKYGDPYSGTYDAVVKYDSASNKCEVTSLDLGKLYKN